MRHTALILTLLLLVPANVRAACNLIPGTLKEFHGAQGALTRPFAAGGERVEVKLRPCDTSPGFGATPEAQVVTVLFEPPSGGAATMFVLTGDPTCGAIDATACAAEVGSNAICIPGGDAGLELVDRSGVPHLGFRFPDTDALVETIGDGRTLAGPATIAVTAAGAPLPCGLAAGQCAAQAGTLACVDDLFANDGSCSTTDRNPTFPGFTALPPPNDYQADCVNEVPPCTGAETELRFALDTAGNVLLPIDWEGILVRDGAIPVPRLMRGTLGLGFAVPGETFLASYTPEGGELAPIFEQQNDPTAAAGVTTFFGSADAPYTILYFARRGLALTACLGGTAAGLPCNVDDECPGGSCAPASCVGGGNDTLPCTSDAECPGGECGPALFDFSPALIAGGAGPAILPRAGDGICQEDVAMTCTVGSCGADGPCVRYKMEALNPVPLEGLQVTDDIRVFIGREDLDGIDRNGDGDAVDSVVTLTDRETGRSQALGADAACMIPGTPEGRAVIRVSDPPFSFPAVATEGTLLAFLESEATTNVPTSVPPGLPCDQNSDRDRADGIVRVFELGFGEVSSSFDITADADPGIDGRSIAISERRVFFRTAEWMENERTTDVASRRSVASGGGVNTGADSGLPAITPDGHCVAFASDAADLVPGDDVEGYVDVFVHEVLAQDTERVSVRDPSVGSGGGNGDSLNPAISADCRFVAFESDASDLVLGDTNEATDIFVHDRCVAHGEDVPACTPSTTRVSVPDIDLEGEDEADDDCFDAAISANGRHVAFRSDALTLVAGDGDEEAPATQVFVHDRITRHTVKVSVDDAGEPAFADTIGRPALSADGRFVAFTSPSDLDDDDDSGAGAGDANVFVHDRDHDEDGTFDETDAGARDTEIASVPTGGGLWFASNSTAFDPSLSADGRHVAFAVSGHNESLDTGVFVRDRADDRTDLVSRKSSGEPVDGGSQTALSPDGRYVGFVLNGEIRGDDDDGNDDVYVHDRLTAITELVSVEPDGTDPSTAGGFPALSTFARAVAFEGLLDSISPAASQAYLRTNGPLDPLDPNEFFFASELFFDGLLDDVVLQVLDAGIPLARERGGFAFVRTLCPAGDVSVAAGNAAFLRPEAEFSDFDARGKFIACPEGPLNGDGLADDDTVVHLWTGEDFGPVPNLGRGGTAVALAPAWLAALISEAQDDVNYNGDGDKTDDVVQVHAVPDPNEFGEARGSSFPVDWANVGQAADALDIAGSLVAFLTPEADQGNNGTNLNGASGDGDKDDRVLQVYDADTASLTNVGVAGEEFVLGELAAATPCGDVQLVAVRTSEAAQGNTNLNGESLGVSTGDADTLDDVLHVYDAVSDTLRNPGQAVTPCTIPECDPRLPYVVDGAKVTFLTLEPDQGGQDLNGDGTTTQLIIQVYDFCTNTLTVLGAVDDDPRSNPLLNVEESQPFTTPAGRCHPNVGCDPTVTGDCGPGAFCENDTCDLDTGSCIVHAALPCATDADCPRCVLREPGTCLVDEDCPAGTTCEAASVSVVANTRDLDQDGVPDERDNCPATPNTFQDDADGDGIGDRCDPRTCGNGIQEPGEICDDGNQQDGDGCPAICSGCPEIPLGGCRASTESGRSSLTLDDRAEDRKDRLRWRWGKGEATTKAEFGDPLTTDEYQLCLYDGSGLIAESVAPAGGECSSRRPVPCWHEKRTSFNYRDLDLTPAGIRKLELKAGGGGRSKIDVRARGPLFVMPDLGAITSPVTAQLASSNGQCWEAVYSAPFRMQGPGRFRARSD